MAGKRLLANSALKQDLQSSTESCIRRGRIFSGKLSIREYSIQPTSSSSTGPNQPTKTLAHILSDSIKASGPLSVSTFMRTCLLEPTQGYYGSANVAASGEPSSSREVLGARGDFITSPEISQVFGELLAIFFIARWQATEMCQRARLVELGPGRGTLLADMLRTFSRFSTFFHTIKEIHLVETSAGLMELQHDAISEVLARSGKKLVGAEKEEVADDEVRIEWFPLVDSVPLRSDTWSMVIAHEFFDALPIHVFERTMSGFREVLVDVERQDGRRGGITILKPSDIDLARNSSISKENEKAHPKFRYVLSPTATPWSMLLAERNPRFQVLQPGQRVEVSPEAWAAARRIGEVVSGRAAKSTDSVENQSEETAKAKEKEFERLKGRSMGGAGLVIDYGDEKAFGGSFRAFKSHKIVDPLEKPGTADLTANVDFAYMKSAIATTDARPLGVMFQAHFLKALGLEHRVEALKTNATTDDRKDQMEKAAKRLVDPTGMGAQYKILGISAEQTEDGERSTEGNRCYPFEM